MQIEKEAQFEGEHTEQVDMDTTDSKDTPLKIASNPILHDTPISLTQKQAKT